MVWLSATNTATPTSLAHRGAHTQLSRQIRFVDPSDPNGPTLGYVAPAMLMKAQLAMPAPALAADPVSTSASQSHLAQSAPLPAPVPTPPPPAVGTSGDPSPVVTSKISLELSVQVDVDGLRQRFVDLVAALEGDASSVTFYLFSGCPLGTFALHCGVPPGLIPRASWRHEALSATPGGVGIGVSVQA